MRAPKKSTTRDEPDSRPTLAVLDGGRHERTGGDDGGYLVMIYGPALGQRWPIERELLIGRDEGCDVVVGLDTVSRRHCIVSMDGDSARVRDLGSTNGTFVNECPTKGDAEAILTPGDRLRAGGAIFKFLQGDHVEALYHEEIYRTMIVDGLTQAHNRRFLLEFLDRELARHQRHQRPLSLLLFDLDDFKRINDDWGHLTGDAVLRELAELVRARVRREDCFARWGGEEFAVALSETDPEAAQLFAERVRRLVEEHEFRSNGERLPVTISVGVATAPPDLRDAEAFLAAADALLYEAKRQGRNRVAR